MLICERCGQNFNCGVNGIEHCWCQSMPSLKAIPKSFQNCLCFDCLSTFAKKNDFVSSDLTEAEDYYLENGLLVFTEKYHLKKGYCCQNKCRHCPYRIK